MDIIRLKEEVEADENIVSFSLFYDRKAKKMVFIKHGDEGIIDKMVNKAAYGMPEFGKTISKIAWRWNQNNSNERMSRFAPGSKEQELYDAFFGGFGK